MIGREQATVRKRILALYDSTVESTTRCLDKRTPAGLRTLVETVFLSVNKAQTDLAPAKVGISLTLQCGAGCAWCCYAPVDAGPLEVLYIAEKLRKKLSSAQLAELEDRLEQAPRASLDPVERVRTGQGCPFLNKKARCTIYDFRPLACRGLASTDAAKCRSDASGETEAAAPLYGPYYDIAAGVSQGLLDGLHSMGFDARQLQLPAAVLRALRTRNAIESWLSYGDVFGGL